MVRAAQRMEGAKKRIFGIFKGFLVLYAPQKRHKLGTSLDFVAFLRQRILQRFWGTFCANFDFAAFFCGVIILCCLKNAAKFNEVPQKRCFCGAYKCPKIQNGQKYVYYVVGCFIVIVVLVGTTLKSLPLRWDHDLRDEVMTSKVIELSFAQAWVIFLLSLVIAQS